jgi:hypothetical protein
LLDLAVVVLDVRPDIALWPNIPGISGNFAVRSETFSKSSSKGNVAAWLCSYHILQSSFNMQEFHDTPSLERFNRELS